MWLTDIIVDYLAIIWLRTLLYAEVVVDKGFALVHTLYVCVRMPEARHISTRLVAQAITRSVVALVVVAACVALACLVVNSLRSRTLLPTYPETLLVYVRHVSFVATRDALSRCDRPQRSVSYRRLTALTQTVALRHNFIVFDYFVVFRAFWNALPVLRRPTLAEILAFCYSADYRIVPWTRENTLLVPVVHDFENRWVAL